ncbi:MAG: hypothetical protein JRH20_01770 [Deltaproteobacteria bacterium]|nr:hypothetical protein [Deltaproteobacteria bacterium]
MPSDQHRRTAINSSRLPGRWFTRLLLVVNGLLLLALVLLGVVLIRSH